MGQQRRIIALTIALSAGLTAAASAQQLRLGWIQAWTPHPLVNDPAGANVSLSVEPIPRIGVRVSYQSLVNRFASFGTICAVFVSPDYVCSGETVDHRAQVHAWTVSLPITVLRTSRAEVAVVVGESSQAMKSTESGRSSDRVRHADKVFRGLVLGTDVSFAPFPDPRVRAFLSAGTTNLDHFRHLRIADGYTPFEQPIRVWSVQLGLEWSR